QSDTVPPQEQMISPQQPLPIPVTDETSIPSMSHMPVNLEDVSTEDYGTYEEQSKPDDVDNDAIQQLVDRFLNKGSLDNDKTEKLNKEVQELIGSSQYWKTDSVKEEGSIKDNNVAADWVQGYNTEAQKILKQVAVAGWKYFTSVSSDTKQMLDEAEDGLRMFISASSRQARQFDISSISDSITKRQIELISVEGMSALSNEKFMEYNEILSTINKVFTATDVCEVEGQKSPCLLKFSDLRASIANSRDPEKILNLWKSWRNTVGKDMTKNYRKLIDLTNEGAKLNGFKHAAQMWLSPFDLSTKERKREIDLMAEIDKVYSQIEPLYKQLHAYVRREIAAIYNGIPSITRAKLNGFKHAGQMWLSPFDLSTKERKREIDLMAEIDKVYSQIEPLYKQLHAYVRREIAAVYNGIPSITRDAPIPVHLLKGVNGDDWSQHYEDTKPFIADDDIPEEVLRSMRKQNITAKAMFTKAYRFMKFLGFERLPKTFWNKSVFSRIWTNEMICDPATAYDMMDGIDYRVKICAQVGAPDFVEAHQLLAQLYYKYSSRRQPLLLRDSPNPSLMKAIEKVFGIIAGNPDYMKSQKLVGKNAMRDEAIMVNRLYKEALSELVKLPFDIVVDKWRFGVFDNQYDETKWNAVWWKLREKYQGVGLPLEAGEATEYDAVTSPGVARQHSPAMKHFVSYVIQFQILDALCMGDSTPLSEGCIPKMGQVKKLIAAMEKGSEFDWLDALEVITGSRKLDATPMLLYYEPLHNWLLTANKKDNAYIGWDGTGKLFTKEELPMLQNAESGSDALPVEENIAYPGEECSNDALPVEENIAYPGEECSNGQECLLESVCNGTICVCNEGLFTLHIGNTYNCVQGNPADAGFGNGDNLVIGLYPNENQTSQTAGIQTTTSVPKHNNASSIKNNIPNLMTAI
uniref:Angiotensin-converting enzyme n=1 Tax=Panagrolaimus sp. PS1159 TaxID=55785 RepID=A0AC35GUI2_9BILA